MSGAPEQRASWRNWRAWRIEQLDRRVIFLLMFLAVLLPLLRPVGLPIVPTRKVIGLYDAIEGLPEGSVVYFAADWDPGGAAELMPMAEAALRHLFRRKMKVIAATTWPTAGPLTANALRKVADEEFHLTYGVDYVDLGFKEGREIAMVSIATDIANAYPVDARGTPTASLPLMQRVKSFHDVAILLSVSAGYPGTKEWLQQVQGRWQLKTASLTTAVSEPEFVPNYQSGQLVGLVGGLAGAAEYETLIGVPGAATKGMDAQSLGHLVIIALIVVSNAVYLAKRGKAREAKREQNRGGSS
ncbi:MAG: hypothetical protein ACKVU1_18400 [bacterium]